MCCHATPEGLRLADGILDPVQLDCQLPRSERSTIALIACKGARSAVGPFSVGARFPDVLLRKGTGAVVAPRWDVPELSALLFADYLLAALSASRRPMEAFRRAVLAVERCTALDLQRWGRSHLATVHERCPTQSEPWWFQAALAWEQYRLAQTVSADARGSLSRSARALLQDAFPTLTVTVETERLPLFELRRVLTALRTAARRHTRLGPMATARSSWTLPPTRPSCACSRDRSDPRDAPARGHGPRPCISSQSIIQSLKDHDSISAPHALPPPTARPASARRRHDRLGRA